MPTLSRILLPATLAATLTGCAINALRVEAAGSAAGEAKAATTAARSYLATVQTTRQAANADLIAIDAQCAPDSAFIRVRPDYAAFRHGGDPSGWLCAHDKSTATYPTAIDLAPIDRELEPDFALIDAIGAYGDAISGILSDKSGDPTPDILGTIELAQSGVALAKAIGVAGLPADDDPRIKAATGLITLFGQLAGEQHQVDRLRTLTASTGVAPLIHTLRDHLANWDLGRRADNNLRLTIAKSTFAQILSASPRPGPTARRAALADYYDRNKQTYAAASLGGAVDAALAELAATDEHFRAVLRDNPKLTAKDRDELARITRQRMTAAFNALAALILAFKGV